MGKKLSLSCILYTLSVSGRDKNGGKTYSPATVTRHTRKRDDSLRYSATTPIVDSQSESDEQNDGFRVCFQVDLLILQASDTFPTHFS